VKISFNSENAVELKAGDKGKVLEIDEDGDANIKFDGHETNAWVAKGFWDVVFLVGNEEGVPEVALEEEEKEPEPDVDKFAELKKNLNKDDYMNLEHGVVDTSGIQDLGVKLGALSDLMKARPGGVDKDLEEKVAGLRKQLEQLGLDMGKFDKVDGKSFVEGVPEFGSGEGENLEGDLEVKRLISACVSMSMKRAGAKKPTTTGALRRLGAGLTKEEAKDMEVVKLIASCINEISDAEYNLYKQGALSSLPKAMVKKALGPSGAEQVLAVEEDIWVEVQNVTGEVVKRFGEVFQDKNVNVAPGEAGSTASRAGFLAFVPLIAIFGFLGYKFWSLQQEANQPAPTKAERKAAKKKQ